MAFWFRFVSFSLDSLRSCFCWMCALCDCVSACVSAPATHTHTLDSRSRFLIGRPMAIPISGRRQMSYEFSFSLQRLVFLFAAEMTLTADLLLLLYRIARLETQKKSSFHSLALLCIILMLILYFAPNSFCFSLRPRSAGKCRTQSVGLSFDSHHFCGLSPGEVDGKFRNGFQQ